MGTPSDESTIAAIREAHRLGLRVMLRPYIDVNDGSWRADITPSDTNAWFANYTTFINHYLDMAKAEGVEEFTLGVELINMTQPAVRGNWTALIAQSRARYSGVLTYSANWGKSTRNEYKQITWWDQLDYIGLSAYFPSTLKDSPPLDRVGGRVDQLHRPGGDTYHWVDEIKATARPVTASRSSSPRSASAPTPTPPAAGT